MELIKPTDQQIIVVNPAGRESYRARVIETTDGDSVQPPLGGGGYVTLGDLIRAGYTIENAY